MDCEKLHADIDRLRRVVEVFRKSFDELYDEPNKNNKNVLASVYSEAEKIESELLKTYAGDLKKNNSELFDTLSFSEAIEGCSGEISLTLRLSDDTVLVCEESEYDFGGDTVTNGIVRVLNVHDGEYDVDEDASFLMQSIETALRLSDSEALIFGTGGEVCVVGREDNKTFFKDLIRSPSTREKVASVLDLSENEVLVFGAAGETRILHKENGEWSYEEDVEWFDDRISTTVKLSEDEALVCGVNGKMSIFRKENGKYAYTQTIEGLREGITSVEQVSEDEFLLFDNKGVIFVLRRTDGGYRIDSKIEGGGHGYGGIMGIGPISATQRLSENEFLICSDSGFNRILSKLNGEYHIKASVASFGFDGIVSVQQMTKDEFLACSKNGKMAILSKTYGEYRLSDMNYSLHYRVSSMDRISEHEVLVYSDSEMRAVRYDAGVPDLDAIKQTLPAIAAKE